MAQALTEKSVFPPMTGAEMARRGWEAVDVLLITDDAYVDHPSFGTAVIARMLEKTGYRVRVAAQPDWENPEAFTALNRPTVDLSRRVGIGATVATAASATSLPRTRPGLRWSGESGGSRVVACPTRR